MFLNLIRGLPGPGPVSVATAEAEAGVSKRQCVMENSIYSRWHLRNIHTMLGIKMRDRIGRSREAGCARHIRVRRDAHIKLGLLYMGCDRIPRGITR